MPGPSTRLILGSDLEYHRRLDGLTPGEENSIVSRRTQIENRQGPLPAAVASQGSTPPVIEVGEGLGQVEFLGRAVSVVSSRGRAREDLGFLDFLASCSTSNWRATGAPGADMKLPAKSGEKAWQLAGAPGGTRTPDPQVRSIREA